MPKKRVTPRPKTPLRGLYAPLLIPILDGFEMIGVRHSKGYELIKQGKLATVVKGGRRFVTPAELERYASAEAA